YELVDEEIRVSPAGYPHGARLYPPDRASRRLGRGTGAWEICWIPALAFGCLTATSVCRTSASSPRAALLPVIGIRRRGSRLGRRGALAERQSQTGLGQGRRVSPIGDTLGLGHRPGAPVGSCLQVLDQGPR